MKAKGMPHKEGSLSVSRAYLRQGPGTLAVPQPL